MLRRVPLLLFLAGCPSLGEPPPTAQPAPEGFTYDDPVECDSPTTGIDRFSEEGVARGLTEPLSDPAVFGPGRAYGRGGAVVAKDFDGDGDVDLLFGRLQAPPDLYANDGAGDFTLVQERLQLPLGGTIPAITAVDLNGDRLPEIVLGGGRGFVRYDNLGDLRFGPPRTMLTAQQLGGLAFLTLAFGDVDGDGDLDVALPSMGATDDDGGADGEPEPTQDLIALLEPSGLHAVVELDEDDVGSTVQVGVFTDHDADGDLDVFFPSDSGPPSRLWANDASSWTNVGPDLGADLAMAAMGIDAFDLNGDGRLDYCMSDTGPPLCIQSHEAGYLEVGTSLELLPAAPVGSQGTVGWGLDLADLDADGRIDALQASGPFPDAQGEVFTDLPNLLWHGTADGRFDEVGAEVGFDSTDNDLGLVTVDLDGDGFLEIVVAGPLDTPELHMNRCGDGAWLRIEPFGPPGNAEGNHVRVEVEVDGKPTQLRELHNTRGQSVGPASLHFGLGDVDVIDRLVVHWSDGHVMEARGVPTRRGVRVEHPDHELLDPVDDDDDAFSVLGVALSLYSQEPMEGITITAGDLSATTGPEGTYTISVPEDATVDLVAAGEGLTPQVTAVDTSVQRGPEDGVLHFLIPAADHDDMYTLHGDPRDETAGSLWVDVVAGTGGRGLVGAVVSLSAEHAPAILLGGEGAPRQSQTVEERAKIVAFGNVPAAQTTISVATPDGETCVGRTSVTTTADAITYVRLRCE